MLKPCFDNTGRGLTRPSWSAFAGEFWSYAAYRPRAPAHVGLPQGNGEPVFVIPAFLTGDRFTYPLRRFLDRCGFRTFGWQRGVNWGPTPSALRHLDDRFEELHRELKTPINVVGISLGGLFARDLAQRRPESIRHVVTIASPVRLPTATPLEPLFHALSPVYSRDLDFDRISAPLPVPWTALYSRRDGIIAWESCVSADANGRSFAVDAPHLVMSRNPDTLRLVVERLAPA